MKKHIAIFILCTLCISLSAQEYLLPLKENKALQNVERDNALERRRVIELPFLDDFYPSDVYPNPTLWEDDLVYINASFAIDPPTIGVATFDGLNAKGQPYSILTNAYGVADELTSLPINLDGLDSLNNVYLSFFFQPKGLGESPDFDLGDLQNQDYLMVEFKDTAGIWDTLWTQNVDTIFEFTQVFIKIEEPFLHGDFQMRFKSVGRLTGAFDHWHLDYVKIDQNRDPEIEATIAEMAYQYWPTPLLEPYYVMPYNQFDSTYIVDSHSVFIKNNFIQATTDIIDFFKAELINTNTILADYSGPSDDVGPNLSFRIDYDKFAIPEDLSDDTVIVRVNYNFGTTAENLADSISIRNNTIVKDQVFSNFFAYDDGSAERAYALKPRQADALFGRTALKFNAKQADTLRAIKLLFTEFIEEENTLNNSNISLFVWQSLETDSTTEELLYQQDLINLLDLPLGDSIEAPNKFSYIPIAPAFLIDNTDQLIVEGDFYIGIGVSVGDILTVGFDLNTDGSANHFVNFGQGWTLTQNTGSLMLNPVLGKALPAQYVVVSNNETVIEELGFSLFPNPTTQFLKVESSVNNGQIEIIDMLGALVFETTWNQNGVLDVNELNPGVYMLRLTDRNENIAAVKQFVKQ